MKIDTTKNIFSTSGTTDAGKFQQAIVKRIKLLSKNTKLVKGEAMGWETWGLSLLPHTMAGGRNLCLFASKGCRFACLETAGMGVFANVREARKQRTLFYLREELAFLGQLKTEIASAVRGAKRKGLKLAVRLNVLSDIPWEETGIFETFPEVRFYDYTPNPHRMEAFLRGEMAPNYHLTFSRKENNDKACDRILSLGGRVAVVFDSVPKKWGCFPVIDGDVSDLRFLDQGGLIVGLKAKGKGKKDASGFVVMTGGGE